MNENMETIRETFPEPTPAEAPDQAADRSRAVRKHAGTKEYILAAALLLFSFLLWDSIIWARRLGLGEGIGLLGIMVTVLIYLQAAKKRSTVYSWVCGALFLFGAASLFLSGDNSLKLLTLIMLTVLYLAVVMDRLSLRTGVGLIRRVRDFFVTAFPHSFGRIARGWISIFGRATEGTGRSRKVGAVLIGLACAIPVLLILIPLLVSSDAAFAGLVSILDWDVFFRGIFALSIGAFSALTAYSLLFCNAPAAGNRGCSGFRGIDPFAVTAFLGMISLAYVLYLVAQFAYFFDGFRGLLPKDYTVAQYARRGFFEMCAIVFINLALILAAWKLCRRKEAQLPAAVRGLLLFLCLVSLLLVGTALSKMVLYVKSFGLTRLRITTSAFMIFLAVLVVSVTLRLFIRRLPAVSIAVAAAALLLFSLSVANVDGMIARHNIRRYREGSLESLDMGTIEYLGNGAIPYVVDLLEDPDPVIAEKAREMLQSRSGELGLRLDNETGKLVDEGLDLRSWNLVDRWARDAIAENQSRVWPYLYIPF